MKQSAHTQTNSTAISASTALVFAADLRATHRVRATPRDIAFRALMRSRAKWMPRPGTAAMGPTPPHEPPPRHLVVPLPSTSGVCEREVFVPSKFRKVDPEDHDVQPWRAQDKKETLAIPPARALSASSKQTSLVIPKAGCNTFIVENSDEENELLEDLYNEKKALDAEIAEKKKDDRVTEEPTIQRTRAEKKATRVRGGKRKTMAILRSTLKASGIIQRGGRPSSWHRTSSSSKRGEEEDASEWQELD